MEHCLIDVGHEYYSNLLSNDDSNNIDEYAYQCAYCMSHDWMKETATWEDVQKAVKLGAQWQALHSLDTIKGMEEQSFLSGVESEQIRKTYNKEELLNKWRNKL